jgi:hypothetical protein
MRGGRLWLSKSLSKTLSIVSNIVLITAIGSFTIFVLTILFVFVQLSSTLPGAPAREPSPAHSSLV